MIRDRISAVEPNEAIVKSRESGLEPSCDSPTDFALEESFGAALNACLLGVGRFGRSARFVCLKRRMNRCPVALHRYFLPSFF